MTTHTKAVVYLGARRPSLERHQTFLLAQKLNMKILLIHDEGESCEFPSSVVKHASILDQGLAHIVNKVAEWSKHYIILGFVNWHDKTTRMRAELCTRFKLPGLSSTSAILCTNKSEMKNAIGGLNILPRYKSVEAKNVHVQEAIEEIGLPVVLKPSTGTSSKGITEVFAHGEVVDRVNSFLDYLSSPEGCSSTYGEVNVLVEEMVFGHEVSVDGLVHNGKVFFTGIVDFRSSDRFHLDYHKVFPSELPKSVQEEVLGACKEVISAIKLDNSAFHFEGCVTETGFKFYEIAARPGAGCIATHLVPISTGIDYLTDYLRVCMGMIPDGLYSETGPATTYSGIIYPLASRSGVFSGVQNIYELIDKEGVEAISLDNKYGGTIDLPPVSYADTKCLYAIVSGTSYDEVSKNLNWIEKTCGIIVS